MLAEALKNYPVVFTDEQKGLLRSRVTEGSAAEAVATMEHAVQLACCVEYALLGHCTVTEEGGEVAFEASPASGQAVRDYLDTVKEKGGG